MRTIADFVDALLHARRRPEAGYGGEVLAAGRVLSSVANDAELRAFKEAMVQLLASPDADVRKWAVTVGSGFQYFRDSIEAPTYAHRELPSDRISDGSLLGEGGKRDTQFFLALLRSFVDCPNGMDDALGLETQAAPGDEAVALLDALEALLAAPDERARQFGVDICVEFVLRKPPHGPLAAEGPTEFVVHSGEPFRLNRNFKLRARKLVAIQLPRAILSPEGTPLSEIVRLSNQDATVGLVEAKPGEGVAAIVFELKPGDEISLARSSEAIADDGTEGGVIVFDAQAA